MAALININLGKGRSPRRRRGPGGPYPRGRKPWWWGVVALVIAGVSYFARQQGWIADGRSGTVAERPEPSSPRSPSNSPATPPFTNAPDKEPLAEAIRTKRSGVLVEATGAVTKTLPDDNEGARHQRFLVRAGNDTVLIAHNLDLAPRIPLKEGDVVRFKGEFEWNDRGGVVHWTHHDPGRRRPGGWVEVRGKRYE
jgi:hypothetical protein